MGILKVGVLGAGIVGLLSAEEITKALPLADVTVIADKYGMDTTSDGAAGLFMPVLYGFNGPTETLTRQYIEDSYNYYSNFVNKDCGVREIDGFILSETTKNDCYCTVLSKILPIYREATEEELLKYKGNWRHGAYVKTLITKSRNFLPDVLQRLIVAGVKVKQRKVNNFKDLENEFDIVINCSGNGAAELCDDYALKSVRGQVLKARTPGQEEFILAGEDTYIIPYGSGISTLGGTHQLSYHNTSTCAHDTQGILDRCQNFLPNLKKSDIVWEWAGLRPFRHVVRVEPEIFGKLKIVHNYGHGGCGVTTAPGTSKHAVLLAQNLLKMSKL